MSLIATFDVKSTVAAFGLAAAASLFAWSAPLHAAPQDETGMQYALVSGESTRFYASSGRKDWEDVSAVRRGVEGEFIWLREDGRSYVIRDAALVDQVRHAWARHDQVNKRMDAPRDEVGRERRAADQAVRALIVEARAKGLAQAAPQP